MLFVCTAGAIVGNITVWTTGIDTSNGFAPMIDQATPTEQTADTVIVDDDLSCRTLLEKFLRVRGHITGSAASLAEARAMLPGECKRVILDLNLPDGQGTELLRQIRDANMPIKVAVTTGVSDRQLFAEVSKLQPDAFFVKPVDLIELMAWIKTSEASPA
jgi:DNA-binding response OmpR family regulator